MAEVLSEDEVLFFNACRVVFVDLNIVNALLQFLIVLLLKCVDVEHKQVAIIASDPSKVVMDAAAEKSMA